MSKQPTVTLKLPFFFIPSSGGIATRGISCRMIRALTDLLVLSCLAAVIIGIVVVVANVF